MLTTHKYDYLRHKEALSLLTQSSQHAGLNPFGSLQFCGRQHCTWSARREPHASHGTCLGLRCYTAACPFSRRRCRCAGTCLQHAPSARA